MRELRDIITRVNQKPHVYRLVVEHCIVLSKYHELF